MHITVLSQEMFGSALSNVQFAGHTEQFVKKFSESYRAFSYGIFGRYFSSAATVFKVKYVLNNSYKVVRQP